MSERHLMLKVDTDTAEEFEQLCIEAKEIGASHVFISALPRSRWQWELDLDDPYSNWGMAIVNIFKLYVPEELRKFLPPDEAKRNLATLEQRCEVLKRYDLSPAMIMSEPFWLPNEAYRAHPSWRGPRIDHPRRSRNLYYSPCIDNPEVLDLYRYAMAGICKEIPVDYIFFKSNDAGAGICWSTGLYAGRNGPAHCQDRDMGERVIGFLSALKQGAADAGVDVVLDFDANLGFKENERIIDTIWPFAPDGVYINGRDNKGNPGKRAVGNTSSSNYTPVSPVQELPDLMRAAERLCDVWKSKSDYIICGVPSVHMKEMFRMIGAFQKKAARDYASTVALARETAVGLVGEQYAGKLTDLWHYIGLAFNDINHLHLPFAMYGTVHQRWLTRPLVAFPERLEQEERDYYRRFQFQALTEENADDLMNIQGLEFIRGFSGTFLATSSLNFAVGHLQQAISCAQEILTGYKDGYAADLELQAVRMKAAICIVRNAINTAKFQEILDSIDPECEPVYEGKWPTPGDPRAVNLQNLIRAEIDNTQELIELIRGREHDILWLTKKKEDEDIFVIGPDIVKVLEHKIDIMFRHYLESNELFETGNI